MYSVGEIKNFPLVSGVIGADEIFVIQLSLDPNLTGEAGICGRSRFDPGQHFHRHDLPHDPVFGLIHLAHAPLADEVEHPIGPEIELGAAAKQLDGLKRIDSPHVDERVGQLAIRGSRCGSRRFRGGRFRDCGLRAGRVPSSWRTAGGAGIDRGAKESEQLGLGLVDIGLSDQPARQGAFAKR